VGTQAMALLQATYEDGPGWVIDQPLAPISDILD
jgi:hypothetical protein